MEPIRIEINLSKRKAHEIIENYPLNKKINMEFEKYESRFIYSFTLEKRILRDELSIYNDLSKLIQDIIIGVYGESLINKRITKLLKNIGKFEREEIKKAVISLLKEPGIFTLQKENILNEILGHLLENNYFIIDGYLRFRSSSINSLIDKSIEKVIDDIQMESDYNEFVSMLEYYVETQVPRLDLVNVIIQKDDFQLLDTYNNVIENQSIDDIVADILDGEGISKSDILVSSLIVLAPARIIIHIENDNEQELLTVLKKIFGDRIVLCYGCNVCRFNMVKDKD